MLKRSSIYVEYDKQHSRCTTRANVPSVFSFLFEQTLHARIQLSPDFEWYESYSIIVREMEVSGVVTTTNENFFYHKIAIANDLQKNRKNNSTDAIFFAVNE